jgi:hypothetical protein
MPAGLRMNPKVVDKGEIQSGKWIFFSEGTNHEKHDKRTAAPMHPQVTDLQKQKCTLEAQKKRNCIDKNIEKSQRYYCRCKQPKYHHFDCNPHRCCTINSKPKNSGCQTDC